MPTATATRKEVQLAVRVGKVSDLHGDGSFTTGGRCFALGNSEAYDVNLGQPTLHDISMQLFTLFADAVSYHYMHSCNLYERVVLGHGYL